MLTTDPTPSSSEPATDTADDSPTHIRVRPSTDAITPETVRHGLATLHRLLQDRTAQRRGRFRTTDTPPTIEWLLRATPDADTTITYEIGHTDPERLDALESILRDVFPDSYEFTRTTLQRDELLAPPTTATPADAQPPTDTGVAAVAFDGRGERRDDWQIRLTPIEDFHASDELRWPLHTVVETMATAAVPMVYQVLLRPLSDWTAAAEDRRARLAAGRDTPAQRWVDFLLDDVIESTDEHGHRGTRSRPGHPHAERIEALAAADTRRSVGLTVRAAAIGTADADPTPAIESLAAAFGDVSTTYYEIVPRCITDTAHARRIVSRIRERTVRTTPRLRRRLIQRLPGTAHLRPQIVADPSTAPLFCLLDGASLPASARRALDVVPAERHSLPRPAPAQLQRYQGPGLTLGHPLTQDDAPDPTPVALPPALQPLHVAWFGKTGSGKSSALVTAMLDNHAATDGAAIIVDPKGDGLPAAYCRAHYARYGDLDDVYYLDCTETLPALSFFDIRPELEAGIDRTTAVEDVVDHYVELLVGIMGRERFERAVRSPDIIRYLVKALFDPIHGADAFAHRDLQAAATRMHDTRDAPPVSDADLEAMLGGIATNSKRSFDELMQGVANRIEKIPVDRRLGRMFNHVPDLDGSDPHFDLRAYLDDDAVIIIDTGGLRTDAQRVLALVLLSNLWSALKRRRRDAPAAAELPLVTLYIEEAAAVADTDLLGELLAQGRGFGLGVTLSMQFPAQLTGAWRRDDDGEDGVRAEVLNNVSTVVTGNVPTDRALAHRLATDDMDPQRVANRLRALRRGQWLASLPAGFDEPEPRPFLLASAPLPRGHPDGDRTLVDAERDAFRTALDEAGARTRATIGLPFGDAAGAPTDADEAAAETDAESAVAEPAVSTHVDTALPYTNRLPDCVAYDHERHALHCQGCETRYDPTATGMRHAIECCYSLAHVDRDDVPITALSLKLSPAEREASGYTDRQLAFLQAVHQAQHRRFDPDLEYNLLRDSMVRLQEYLGIGQSAVQELVDDGLLRVDCDHPHRLYSLSPEGREVIGERQREGIEYGDGIGDLGESSQHVMGVELGRRYIEQDFVADPESPVVEASSYVPVGDGHRLDAAGLDADGRVVVALEAERATHDLRTAVPEDYDTMAACEPDAAIWVVMDRETGHAVLRALNEPADNVQRVEKTYQDSTPPRQFRIDTPGCTQMVTVAYLRRIVLDE